MSDIVMPLPSAGADDAEASPDVVSGWSERTDARAESSPASRFRALVDSHFDFIWRSLRGLGVASHSVDDAAQHVFWIASQKIDGIAHGSERAFLFRVALGVAANARRATARKREVFDEEALHAQVDDAPSGEELVEMQERRAVLDQVLAHMPDEARTVFILFVLEGMAAREIADLLGIAPGTVASRLRRARELFHETSKRLQARAVKVGGPR